MTNLEIYDKAFMDTFEVSKGQLSDLEYKAVSAWDSVGHMILVATLEDAFDILMDTDDIIDFKSYQKGKEILEKKEYGVEF